MPSKQFTAADRTALAEVGKVLSQHAEAFGAESLARLFLTHPASKIYFSEFTDYSAAGPRVRVHGAKVLGAVAKAIGHLDDLHTHLEPLAAKHGHDLVVDPQNFPNEEQLPTNTPSGVHTPNQKLHKNRGNVVSNSFSLVFFY
ncbi:hemoglobin subunit alpha-like isoform X2 [Carcharodon carcharias]|uniref:hemoglobin subunit alpha-like isoform X2 n=1 Tax=Carcharodon carcharias TaxID=13397 RepID=UPI001B7D9724|nr:hemoglobin subunit alpha-like isoform X2 [Carcharodon carcharias]